MDSKIKDFGTSVKGVTDHIYRSLYYSLKQKWQKMN